MSSSHIAIVGGGYSGTLLAIHLLERGARVTLVERADRVARGIAYSTRSADHLLNVRASRMSAFPDQLGHFEAWLGQQGAGDASSFAERQGYGRYLETLLEAARARAGERLDVRRAEVRNVTRTNTGETIELAGGDCIKADAAILAVGNLPSEMPPAIAAARLAKGIYHADPWAPELAAGLAADETVVLIGTGLTAVDATLLLQSGGFEGRIIALSRRGLLPRAHADGGPSTAELGGLPPSRCNDLLQLVRNRAANMGWRCAVDSLRPFTQAIWAGAGLSERRRFLRHLRPWWDVHRHRIAPGIAARVEAMRGAGQLQVEAGRIVAVKSQNGAAELKWRPRAGEVERTALVHRIVNCTGPQSDISRAREPLLDALLESGRIRPDECRIGIDVDAQCRTLSARGASDSLLAVGPVTRGTFWEIVAVPDIRQQVRDVAAALVSR